MSNVQGCFKAGDRLFCPIRLRSGQDLARRFDRPGGSSGVLLVLDFPVWLLHGDSADAETGQFGSQDLHDNKLPNFPLRFRSDLAASD